MQLETTRIERSDDDNASIGNLFINSVRECWTLEDKVREIIGNPVSSWKVKHETAIPSTNFYTPPRLYKVTLVWSPHFQSMVPLINRVDGFDAIEVHWGNKSKDTDGCILVGQAHPAHKDWIGQSNAAWDALMPKLEAAFGVERQIIDARGKPVKYRQVRPAEEVWLKVTNDFPSTPA